MRKIIVTGIAILAITPQAVHANALACGQEVQRGVASWYGTMVKVVNMRNHKSVTVKVNDRGAFSSERVIDLSQGAAQQIDMIDDGVAPVAIYKCNH